MDLLLTYLLLSQMSLSVVRGAERASSTGRAIRYSLFGLHSRQFTTAYSFGASTSITLGISLFLLEPIDTLFPQSRKEPYNPPRSIAMARNPSLIRIEQDRKISQSSTRLAPCVFMAGAIVHSKA